MGELSPLNIPDLSNLEAWVLAELRRPPPPKIDVRMTTLRTGETIDILMVISIDDDKN
jgi:hypothetical protein